MGTFGSYDQGNEMVAFNLVLSSEQKVDFDGH